MGDFLLGWLAVGGAIISFGSFAVPIKILLLKNPQPPIHPFVFQSYKSFWCFTTSWLVLTFRDFQFTWWGIVSAVFWVPAGAAYVVAVDHIGVGLTQAVVSASVITVSTLWGFLFFDEEVSNPGLAVLAFAMLAGGVSTMSYYSAPVSKERPVLSGTPTGAVDEDSSRASDQPTPAPRSEKSASSVQQHSPLLGEQNTPLSDYVAVAYTVTETASANKSTTPTEV
jgi:multidrug transporter EmrE-like cation transporter